MKFSIIVGLLFLLSISLVAAVNITDHAGWPQSSSAENCPFISPAIGEFDGSNSNGSEIVTVIPTGGHGCADVTFKIFHEDGSGVTGSSIGGVIRSNPAAGDLDDNTQNGKETVFAVNNNLYAFYSNGTLLWGPIALGGTGYTPAIADVDNDGSLEIAIGVDSTLYLLDNSGNTIWSKSVGGTIESAPALGDIDADGTLEIVVGNDNGEIYVLESDSSIFSGWPKTAGSEIRYSSPALGDIDNDGDIEIVTGASHGSGGRVVAFESDGTLIFQKTISAFADIESSPALGDLDGDGDLEIVIGEISKLHALHHDGSYLTGWPITLGPGPTKTSPILADVDGDTEIEILIQTSAIDPARLYIIDPDGSILQTKILSGYSERISPAVGEDVNGKTVIAAITVTDSTTGNAYLFDTQENFDLRYMPWTMYHGDAANTGMHYPVAKITSPSVGLYKRNVQITFNGTGLTNDGAITSYEWDFDGDGTYDYTSSSPTTSHSYSVSGNHTPILKVTDSKGAVDTVSRTISINYPPTPTIIAPADGKAFDEETLVAFNGTGSDTEGTIASYHWTADGIFIGDTATFNASFTRLGSKTINLTVTDDLGATGSTEINITISKTGVAPVFGVTSTTVVPTVFDGKEVLNEEDIKEIFDSFGHLSGDIYSFDIQTAPLASVYISDGEIVVSEKFREFLSGSIPNLEEQVIEKNDVDIYGAAVDYILEKHPNFVDLVITRGDLHFDSLAAAPLSNILDAPILFVKPDEIPAADFDVLDMMDGKGRIYIIGGPEAVSKSVEEDIGKYADKVVRIGGATRYETSIELAKEMLLLTDSHLAVSVSGSDPVFYAASLATRYSAPLIYLDTPPIKKSTFKNHFITHGNINVENIDSSTQPINKENPIDSISFSLNNPTIKDSWMYVRTTGYDTPNEKWILRLNGRAMAYNVHSEPITTYENRQFIRFDAGGNLVKTGENILTIEGTSFDGDEEITISGLTLVNLVDDSTTKTEYWIVEGKDAVSFETPSFSSSEKATLSVLYMSGSETSSIYFNNNKIYPSEKRGHLFTIKEADVTKKVISSENTFETRSSTDKETSPIVILTVESVDLQLPTVEIEEKLDIHQESVNDFIFENFDVIGRMYF